MRGAWIALLATVAFPSVALGWPSLSMPQAEKVTGHIRHRELRNDFGLRGRMGGAFKLAHVWCDDPQSVHRITCHYEATGKVLDDKGRAMRCSIDVRVQQHRRLTWKRSVRVCARQLVP